MIEKNAKTIENEINWLEKVVAKRLEIFFNNELNNDLIFKIQPPILTNDTSVYATILKQNKFNFFERITLILALIPQIKPQILDTFIKHGACSDFGGHLGQTHKSFLPTGETLIFILCGNSILMRIRINKLFDAEHIFTKHRILELHPVNEKEPPLSVLLTLSNNYFDLFTSGEAKRPSFSSNFPATLISTTHTWDDIILNNSVHKSLKQIILWIEHKDNIKDNQKFTKNIKPGYRALFYGSSGTGKTFAACLLGRSTGKEVYKIDLSMVVSKWVGETQKNLALIFDMAENKDWILFFDEADAIFGKRTDTKSSQDKFANQEVAYLLQRTEECSGTVILASNLKRNMDDAFTRRLQSIINFPTPDENERLRLWSKYFDKNDFEGKTYFKKISKRYEITGGEIVNIFKYTVIKAYEKNATEPVLIMDDVIDGLRIEYQKKGKSFQYI